MVLAVSLHASTALSYSPVKLGLRHAVSAYRGGPWEQWGRAGAAQGSIIASGTLRGSRRYLDDAQWHFDELAEREPRWTDVMLAAYNATSPWARVMGSPTTLPHPRYARNGQHSMRKVARKAPPRGRSRSAKGSRALKPKALGRGRGYV